MAGLDERVTIPIVIDPTGALQGAQPVIDSLNKIGIAGQQVGQQAVQGFGQLAAASVAPLAGIENVRKDLAALGAEALKLQQQTAASAQLSQPFQLLQDRLVKLGTTYQETGLIGQRTIASLAVSLRTLEAEYGKNIQAATGLSEAEKQVYQSARSTYDDAIKKQRAYNDELEKVNRSTHNWISLEAGLQSLGGTVGQITTAVVGAAAALETGWRMGEKLDAVLQKIPGYKASWDQLAQSVFGYSQKVSEAADFSNDPRFAGTRTQQLLPQIAARQGEATRQRDISTELQGLGVKTLADAQDGVKQFEHELDLLRQKGGDSIAGFVRDSKSNLEGWARAFTLAGKEVPEAITSALAKLQSADASLTFAKSETAAVQAKQNIQNQFTQLQDFIKGIELKFKVPDTNPITQAVNEAKQVTAQALADIGKQASQIQQSIDLDLSKYRELGAQIQALRESGDTGPAIAAQITALQQRRAEILQTITAERQNLDTLKSEADTVRTQLGPAFEEIRRRDALAEMLAKDAASLEQLRQKLNQIRDEGLKAISDLGLPGNLAAGFQSQIRQAVPTAEQLRGAAGALTIGLAPGFREEVEGALADGSKHIVDASVEGAKHFADAFQSAVEAAQKAFRDFGDNLGDVFAAAIEGGAAGFADAASHLFIQGVKKGVSDLGTVFASVVGGAFGAPPDRSSFEAGPGGEEQFRTAQLNAQKQQEQIGNALSVGLGAVGETVKLLQNAKQGQAPSILATTLSFTAAGASFGWIGAAVGAVVGAVIGIFGQAAAKAAQLYGNYGVRDGQAYLEPNPEKQRNLANIPQQQQQDMLDQVTRALQGTNNAYLKLLGKLGADLNSGMVQEITHANFQPTLDASKNSIKNFMSDFASWVTTTLPRQIADKYKQPLLQGFEQLGLSAQRFQEIWDSLKATDPEQVVKDFNDLIDALHAFREVVEAWNGTQFGITGGPVDLARAEANKSFADQLAKTDVTLVQMGDTMSHLFGPDQIAAAKEWGDALLQRENAVKEFFKQIAAAIDQVIAGYQSKIRDLTLAGMKTPEGGPDIDAQVAYLKKYADNLWQQITHATSPEQVLQLSNELSETISKIQQIGGSASADAAEAYRKWAIQQLQRAQDLVVGQLNKLAQDVADQNKAFLDAIQGFIDAFLKATDEINNNTTDRPGDDTSVTPGNPPPGTGVGVGGNVEHNPNPKYDPDRGIFGGPGGGDYANPFENYGDPSGWRPPSEPNPPGLYASAHYGESQYIPPGYQSFEPWQGGAAQPPPAAGVSFKNQQAPEPGGGVPSAPDYSRFFEQFVQQSTKTNTLLDRREVAGAVSDGSLKMVAAIERLAVLQERIVQLTEQNNALLADGIPVDVSVGGGMDITIDDQPAGTAPLYQDEGAPRRVVMSRGKRA